ncbi:hypothetical protein N7516_005522 [Penicillium verrucosum]|uniref:uncharacterized protein n=1 Tax=Penicillium verrucosum TaxID=60171 RepID=UPI002544E754|nr:uncharacterized protein N7516_005522 [Penicillium verrucosum]KAJ5945354.1 hypothetical protein N7516_005522 [Penicillium verrucosum]
MKTTLILALAAAAASAQELCEQYGVHSEGKYIVNNNMWGKDSGTGSQCTTVDGIADTGVSWHTKWSWSGGEGEVKTYPNSGVELDVKLVSELKSIKTSAKWGYDNSDINADVAYDLFTAADKNHETSGGDYELMIWLGRYGTIAPIGKKLDSVDVGGKTWELWNGMNGDMNVYSFVAADPITTFATDIKEFFNYLVKSQSFPADSQYLINLQFGTEPFTGDATFTVSNWEATAI